MPTKCELRDELFEWHAFDLQKHQMGMLMPNKNFHCLPSSTCPRAREQEHERERKRSLVTNAIESVHMLCRLIRQHLLNGKLKIEEAREQKKNENNQKIIIEAKNKYVCMEKITFSVA